MTFCILHAYKTHMFPHWEKVRVHLLLKLRIISLPHTRRSSLNCRRNLNRAGGAQNRGAEAELLCAPPQFKHWLLLLLLYYYYTTTTTTATTTTTTTTTNTTITTTAYNNNNKNNYNTEKVPVLLSLLSIMFWNNTQK